MKKIKAPFRKRLNGKKREEGRESRGQVKERLNCN